MANGKAYEAKRFTISHATLALGTVVLLTNEVTGRKTFAEVTDRPPSDADYLLDVSRSVADVLGLAENGGKVTVQVAG
jgi:rare lipoprotein A